MGEPQMPEVRVDESSAELLRDLWEWCRAYDFEADDGEEWREFRRRLMAALGE